MATTLISKLHGEDLFDSLEPEPKKDLEKIRFHKNEGLEDLTNAWESLINVESSQREMLLYSWLNDFENKAGSLLGNLSYQSQDIREFSILLNKYEKINDFEGLAGLFISAAINHCKENQVSIDTKHLDPLLSQIGYHNREKNILINGNAGEVLAREMRSGNITVNGNTGGNTGAYMNGGSIVVYGDAGIMTGFEMKGGEININGNAKGGVGVQMKGGRIYVEGNVENNLGSFMEHGEIIVGGNAGPDVGCEMKGGIIRLQGDYQSLNGLIQGGDIYHKGRQIIRDGKRAA